MQFVRRVEHSGVVLEPLEVTWNPQPKQPQQVSWDLEDNPDDICPSFGYRVRECPCIHCNPGYNKPIPDYDPEPIFTPAIDPQVEKSEEPIVTPGYGLEEPEDIDFEIAELNFDSGFDSNPAPDSLKHSTGKFHSISSKRSFELFSDSSSNSSCDEAFDLFDDCSVTSTVGSDLQDPDDYKEDSILPDKCPSAVFDIAPQPAVIEHPQHVSEYVEVGDHFVWVKKEDDCGIVPEYCTSEERDKFLEFPRVLIEDKSNGSEYLHPAYYNSFK
jgi:hypothetical protein